VTGSIGVIMTLFDASKLLGDTLGIEATPIMSGPYKDMASPLRGMSEQEQEILQGIVDRMYVRFLEVVENSRALSAAFKDLPEDQRQERFRALADGRIYHADQAEEVGLVDGIAYSETVYQRARKRIGLSDAPVVRYQEPRGLAALLQAHAPLPRPGLEIALPEVRFEYRWQPGETR
ncbi:MAG: S49 family peptidase, partial [Planctomycetota bacterium]